MRVGASSSLRNTPDPMTANFRTAALESPPVPAPAPRAMLIDASSRQWNDRVVFPVLIAVLLVLYGLLQNPYWVPAGDSELYVSAARSIAQGEGYTFLGQPVAISPPGWSAMMAAVMKTTPYVWPLKLLAAGCMMVSLLMAYWVARRFVSPAKAGFVVLLTAILSHVYQATFWLISEGAFCLATTASILLAMQISEGGRRGWRIALLLLCCAAAVTIRWAGVLGVILVVASLLDRQWRPRLTLPWIAAALVIIVTVGSFKGWREGLRPTPEQAVAAADRITGTEEESAIPAVEPGPVVGTSDQSAKTYQIFPPGSYADRFLNWGRWFSYLYWQPFRAAGAKAWILALATLTGWALILVLGVLVLAATRQKRWIWLATGMYTGALAMGWPNVNARYYVPVAFLITLGIFLATDELTALTRRWPVWRKGVVAAFGVFVASVAVCNGALYGVEAAIARSARFYQRYEDGMNVPLIAACQYLMGLPNPPGHREIAVSPRYTNLNKTRASPYGIRATVWLTDREILSPRWKDTAAPPNSNPRLARWLRSKGVKWYLYQTEISPWRVWHFRLGWYEKCQTGKTADVDTAGWQLYRLTGSGDWKLLPLRRRCKPVTRVPGL